MGVSVFIERTGKRLRVEIPRGYTVKSLLGKLKINPVSVLVSINNEICTENEVIKDDDSVEIFSVVSGG
ncbi:MAG TPA: MoaD/ThiS family protein [Candidatus Nanoarchaeia archaeon]|nr:MoaD/ThiS family protein [Candidatus Nanoarchaeia archaeon]